MRKRGYDGCGLVWLMALLAVLALLTLPTVGLAEWADGTYQDVGEGFRGKLVATVTIRGGRIESVKAESKGDQPDEYLQTALDGLQPLIVQQNGVEGVEAVSGATGSSKGILEAVSGVLKQSGASFQTDNQPASTAQGELVPNVTPRPTIDPKTAKLFSGFGSVANFREGPGKDENGEPVYSFNVTMASMVFDRDGKIVDARVDVYEVSTPNYDGDSMPHFSGWPNTEGYATFDAQTKALVGKNVNTTDSAKTELEAWVTKRERGDDYGMNPTNDWYQQMNAYEQWMIGKTVQELRSWFARSTSPKNGRPLKASSDDAEDQKLLKAMNDQEKQALVDVTSMATMSLSDSHGLILEAIEKAYDNRKPIEWQ